MENKVVCLCLLSGIFILYLLTLAYYTGKTVSEIDYPELEEAKWFVKFFTITITFISMVFITPFWIIAQLFKK